MKRLFSIYTSLAILAGIALSNAAVSAEIFELSRDQNFVTIAVIGEIRNGDDIKFNRLARNGKYNLVYLDSPGGTVHAAVVIADMIEKLGLNTIIDGRSVCASVCAIMFMAGERRFIVRGGRLGVHAPYLPHEHSLDSKIDPSTLISRSTRNLELRRWVCDLAARKGIDKQVCSNMFLYTGSNVLWIDYDFGERANLYTKILK